MILAGCNLDDARTDPGCYSDGGQTGLTEHVADTGWTTLDQILHPALSWPGAIGFAVWLVAAWLVFTAVRALFAGRGGAVKGAAGAAAKGAAGTARAAWTTFARHRTKTESVHVPTEEHPMNEPQDKAPESIFATPKIVPIPVQWAGYLFFVVAGLLLLLKMVSLRYGG